MRLQSRIYLLFFSALLAFAACRKDNSNIQQPQPPEPTYPAREEKEVAYGSHPYQEMDVYFPEGYNSQTPVVFVIHGGAFAFGLKEEFTTQALLFRDQGFVTVNISHRLVDTAGIFTLPPVHMASAITVADEVDDVHAAVEKYKAMAAGWKSGTGKMYMAGHSAGATLTLLYTYGPYNNDGRIRAAGNWAGATDLSLPHDSLTNGVDVRILELFYRLTGFAYNTQNNLAFMAISPYWVANLHGGATTITIFPENNVVFNTANEAANSLAQTQALHQLLGSQGHTHQLNIYAGADHGFSTDATHWPKLVAETAAFFKAN